MGLPCGPTNTLEEAIEDPQLAYRNMLGRVEDNATGTTWTVRLDLSHSHEEACMHPFAARPQVFWVVLGSCHGLCRGCCAEMPRRCRATQ